MSTWVRGERGEMPDRIIRTQGHKQVKQIAVELLQQQKLVVAPFDSLQKRDQQQLLERYRRQFF